MSQYVLSGKAIGPKTKNALVIYYFKNHRNITSILTEPYMLIKS